MRTHLNVSQKGIAMKFLTPAACISAQAMAAEPEYENLIQNLKRFAVAGPAYSQGPAAVTGLCDSARNTLIALLAQNGEIIPSSAANQTGVVLVPDEKTAYRTSQALSAFYDGVCVFPARDFLLHNIAATSHDFEYERLRVLRGILDGTVRTVVAVPEAALSLLPPKESVGRQCVLRVGDDFGRDRLSELLVSYGYTRTDTVEGEGQFATRGEIMDLFPPASDNPIRLEFFGDTVDAAGVFDVMTQRRIESVDQVTLTPAREILADEQGKRSVREVIDSLIAAAKKKRKNAEGGALVERLQREREDLEQGELHSIDKYLPLVFHEKRCLLDYAGGCLFLVDYPRVKERLTAHLWQLNEDLTDLAAAGEFADSGEFSAKNLTYTYDLVELVRRMAHRPSVVADYFNPTADFELSGLYPFATKQMASFPQNFDVLVEDLKNYTAERYQTVLSTRNDHAAATLSELLEGRGFSCLTLKPDHTSLDALSGGYVYLMSQPDGAALLPGFELARGRFVLLSESPDEQQQAKERGRSQTSHKRREDAKKRILSYADLAPGDYVVHTLNGIGRYEGIKTLTVDHVTRDYITIQYAGSDVLYVPVDQLDKVSKYTGKDENVRLSKMGGAEWKKTKSRVKKAAKDMAKQLIALYAARKKLPGYAFSPDTEWQRDFESRFPYEETKGQLDSITEIKRDMEAPTPMDRLLCGDVGFGKTEVALRAVFKCIMDGKQAAILAPTTILCLQHYQTAVARMQSFPVKVGMLSRFVPPVKAKEIVKKLKTGEIDLVIGTHKLLQKDIVFHDLGLLVVDEEQRFGVAHKERLKEMSRSVDVLTLTATPIPRTFHMALAGIRDMSVLEEAPQDRHPVQTYVLEHDMFILGEAIKKELRRGGQVFYLHNRVEDIENAAARIKQIAPDAVVACAHGKMDKDALSTIWKDLVDGEIDVLVCTTIIETGVDVPNANTLIIEDADKMGLSQLHQLRGRVGRSNRKAYAYFTWKKSAVLSEIAEKRLVAIKEFTEFGSGFKIAMRDLEIRGAGNLLGAEQSGHMEAVGYDLYIKILEQAVLEEQGVAVQEKPDCAIDLKIDAYLPEKYIRVAAGRIEMYKKIAAIETEVDAADAEEELTDRYGPLPEAARSLITIALIKADAIRAGIKKIEQRENKLAVYPAAGMADKTVSLRLLQTYRGKVMFSGGQDPCYNIKLSAGASPLDEARKIVRIFGGLDGR